ncbi:hypothetical protein K4K58_003359 [Colletotrichum sp. SAR11_239]|nr:hypothetical protein K4K58_003359 [Colletotrichum sp. SAR11_239]
MWLLKLAAPSTTSADDNFTGNIFGRENNFLGSPASTTSTTGVNVTTASPACRSDNFSSAVNCPGTGIYAIEPSTTVNHATPSISTADCASSSEGAFIGGVPTTNIDVPVTFLFLLLFSAGAYTHIRIYRANAKRGHKFLLSDLMFDFCMVRNVTCIMRIIWAFEKARVVILIALIVQFGGVATLFFIFSVPAVIFNNSTALGVSFYHIEDQDRVDTALNVLKAGVSWIMLLAILPVVAVLFAAVIPGPKPERFGVGDTHQKIAVLMIGAILLIAGHAVRLTSILNPEPPDSTDKLLSKEVFYTTGFMLEILVVVFYAVIRIDLLFHVPNGSSQPGDYSRKPKPGEDDYEAALLTKEEIEDELAAMGHPYEIVDSSGLGRDGSGRTIVAFSTRRMNGEKPVVLPPRPQAYSRVQSIRGSVRSVQQIYGS